MKYYKNDFEPFNELNNFRQKQFEAMQSQEKALLDRKESLMKKDVAEWGYSGSVDELVGRSHKLYADKQFAFPFMLTADTQKLQETKERVNFVTN